MSAGTQRRQTRSRHRPFRTDRRDPTDRRSWERTPVFVGDMAAHVDDPSWLLMVTGVLPRGRAEVVNVERAQRAIGVGPSFDDVQDALADGRIERRALPRDELSPVTEGLVDRVKLLYAGGDSNEVSR